ncbi:U-box domain-containing protein [Dorcoceras hygrometricum]|uniref:U-box domain-containing protein n=1 Tax=Dorcoceras hygrometricum TaxID=472368 RepID=A0A2Z7AXG5_9LAMI|nr:U-box domain-containing protein [Dorcoceras hygrometricum]
MSTVLEWYSTSADEQTPPRQGARECRATGDWIMLLFDVCNHKSQDSLNKEIRIPAVGFSDPLSNTLRVASFSSTLSSSPLWWHLVFLLRFPQTAPIDVAKLPQPTSKHHHVKDLGNVGRLGTGLCFSSMSAIINHRSEGVGSVSGEAPPMLKSGRVREQKREKILLSAKVCKNECVKCVSTQDSLNKERRIPAGFIYIRKDVSGQDSSQRRDMVLGKHSRNGSEVSGKTPDLDACPRVLRDLGGAYRGFG